jgi:hypothetical protein
MYLQKVIRRKTFLKLILFCVLKINDENSRIRIRIRIHKSEAWNRGPGSGFTQKCHGSGTLLFLLICSILQGRVPEDYPEYGNYDLQK